MDNKSTKSCWFENWFDSEYYHLLYQDRNFEEAGLFIRHLLNHLSTKPSDYIMDLACGRGRHSIFLNSLGYKVLGVDLSENSITSANQFSKEGLAFKVGDMREPQGDASFDLVLNLFTSFGYFESEEENIHTLEAIFTSLKPGGLLVIDFMNSEKVVKNLVPSAEIQKGDIHFQIRKSVENQIIRKEIHFSDKGKNWFFEERVQAIGQKEFVSFFQKTGFEMVHLYGNYELEDWTSENSDRMIFIVRKPD